MGSRYINIDLTIYINYSHSGILSMAWLTCLKIHTVKKKLKNIRLSHVKAHQYQITYLQKRWFDIQSGKRIIIHMASQGYCQPVRASIHNFQIEQSLQAGRLCDIEGIVFQAIPLNHVTFIQILMWRLFMCPQDHWGRRW